MFTLRVSARNQPAQARRLAFIVPQPSKEIMAKNPSLDQKAVEAFVQTPREIIRERMLQGSLLDLFNGLRGPARIETKLADAFGSLLDQGVDETAFQQDAELREARTNYAALVLKTRSGEQKLLTNDLLPLLSRELAEVEQYGSENEKIVARYHHALRSTLERNMAASGTWALFENLSCVSGKDFSSLPCNASDMDLISLITNSNLALEHRMSVGEQKRLGKILMALSTLSALALASFAWHCWDSYTDVPSTLAGGMSASLGVLSLGFYFAIRRPIEEEYRERKAVPFSIKELDFVRQWAKSIEQAATPESLAAIEELEAQDPATLHTRIDALADKLDPAQGHEIPDLEEADLVSVSNGYRVRQ